MTLRAVYRVPLSTATDLDEISREIVTRLWEKRLDFAIRHDGYEVEMGGKAVLRFREGDHMLFCHTGVYKVTPTAAADLRPGDGVAGFDTGHDSDIFDAVFVLKHPPQPFGKMFRLVPDPDRCRPEPYVFGIVYAPDGTTAWKVADDA